jgi:hypothetical protein
MELQLGGVLDREDALALGDEARQHVEQSGLPGARASADENVQSGSDAVGQEVQHRLRQGAQIDEVLGSQALGRKTTNREQRPVNR